jgi:hypothetical protein
MRTGISRICTAARTRLHPVTAVFVTVVVFAAAYLCGCGGGANSSSTVPATPTTTATATAGSTGAALRVRTVPRPGSVPGSTSTPARSPHAFAAAPITHRQASALVRTGQIAIPVAAGGPGEVSAFGQAQIGKAILRVAQAPAVVLKAPGMVVLHMHLTPVARSTLAAGHPILMFVGVQFSNGQFVQRLEVLLHP